MSARLFAEHLVRTVVPLDGLWEIAFPEGDGVTMNPADWPVAGGRPYPVPSVWEALHDREDYRGQALIRRSFSMEEEGPVRLVFRGVSHTARVFVDGTEVGQHHNAYTPFAIYLPSLSAGEHELLLHVSNEHGEASALHIPNDYYNYGGITRPVEMQIFRGKARIRYAHFRPMRGSGGWEGLVRVGLANHGESIAATLRIELAGESIDIALELPSGEERVVEAEMEFPDAQPWSPEHPRLYDLQVTLLQDGKAIDDLRDRTGFRTIETKGESLLLNGKPIVLVGFNRHEDHGAFGCALPLEVQTQDALMLKDLNCNAVRTSHYPNDERFLDLCDELGIMVWEENHARGLSLEQMQHPRFRQQCRDCIAEMIHWHYNHPSIVLWGILNECASESEEGREMYREQFGQIRELDTSRPTTYASCKGDKDICQDLPDVLGWNWYWNWYGNAPVGEKTQEAIEFIDGHGGANKPLIVSEFGAGGIPGYHDPRRRAKWSEDRQLDILHENLAVYLSHPRICGAFIWQFCDVRVDNEYSNSRPRCINDKGVVDEYRRPKLAYELVRDAFRQKLAEVP